MELGELGSDLRSNKYLGLLGVLVVNPLKDPSILVQPSKKK
jgi:hypothetical protein